MVLSMTPRFAFFLGGHDLEMVTIRELLNEVGGHPVYDKNLAWGAKASAYGHEIDEATARGLVPVLIELDDDIDVPAGQIVVDHHGERAAHDVSTSLEQVFSLLDLPRERWTRWFDLVAANDRGHIRELRKVGASDEEIDRVRAADRAAQGITESDERAADEAIRTAQKAAGGRLTIVTLLHSRTAVVADRLEMLADAPENVLVISPGEVNFFGSGSLISTLHERYPGGWMGGSLPERGYWGISPPPRDIAEFLSGAVASLREDC